MSEKESVFITGGTAGLGLALAKAYLDLGFRVGVSGRNLNRPALEPLKGNPRFYVYSADVADMESLREAMSAFAKGGLNIVYANAGTYVSAKYQPVSLSEMQEMIDTNIRGTLNTFMIGSELFRSEPRLKRKHLVAISSMTAIQNYPRATVYAATKKTVLELCSVFRKAFESQGISVTEVIPGYIATEKLMELNRKYPAPRPFILSPDRAAATIIKAVQLKQYRAIFPWQTQFLVRLISLLPGWLQVKALTVLPAKKAPDEFDSRS